ncbi:hypothetical protein HPB52_024818 [Rhipicephalus sanguineus]|uniref:Uncharacterized protein n=1 Tax=Rhipicephalus sanguineus TaxID=34632 RepID=A0A9D4TDU9_RHISA|nr:hypothetical protein HPB52_024818 [Rhipicephalus sanguineus]
MRLRRLNSLIFSDHFQGSVAASKDFVRRALRQAEGLAVYKGDIIDSSAAERKYWTRVLHGRVDLSEAHEHKRRKYLIPDMLMHITSATGASSYPIVSSITMTYRGTWATESARIMLDLGLGREHMKIATHNFSGGDHSEYMVCSTCKDSLVAAKVPAMSVTYRYCYPPKPEHLPALNPVEERLIAPRLSFMSIRRLTQGNEQYAFKA